MEANVPLLLAHEMIGVGGQQARAGCAFSNFFITDDGATPPDLIQSGIYAKIAVALKGGEWRKTSMVLLAQSLDAHAAELTESDKVEMQREQQISKSVKQEMSRVIKKGTTGVLIRFASAQSTCAGVLVETHGTPSMT